MSRRVDRLRRHQVRLLPAFALAIGLGTAPTPRAADSPDPIATLVVDARSGAVLHAERATTRLHPASLTKLMTVYLVLDAIRRGAITVDSRWPVSAHAASQPPTSMGLDAGEEVPVGTLLLGLAVASANDAAMVAAEALGGDEATFVERMNATAAALGLRDTTFGNPSGLPDPEQLTTARDMALLALALEREFPGHGGLFASRSFVWNGRTEHTTNRFLTSYTGADGMKTGFTCNAGYNLVATATRDGRRLLGVVLAASSTGQRDATMRALLDRAFGAAPTTTSTLAALGPAATTPPPRRGVIAEACLAGPSGGWNVDLGVARTERAARDMARSFIGARRATLGGGRPLIIPRYTGVTLYRACVTGVTEERARATCLAYRREGGQCVIFGPDAARRQVEDAKRIQRLQSRRSD